MILLLELVMFARQLDDARRSVGLSGSLIAAYGMGLVILTQNAALPPVKTTLTARKLLRSVWSLR